MLTQSEKLVRALDDRPSTAEVKLVNTKLFLSISIAYTCVNVVIIKHRTQRSIIQNTLTARPIYPAMRLENGSTATLKTGLAALINLYPR